MGIIRSSSSNGSILGKERTTIGPNGLPAFSCLEEQISPESY